MAITAGPIFALVLREQEGYYPKLEKQSRGLRKRKPLHVQAAKRDGFTARDTSRWPDAPALLP